VPDGVTGKTLSASNLTCERCPVSAIE